jgi:DNA-binding XRE family transcriptional regulator
MARIPLPYAVDNNLDQLFRMEQGKRLMETGEKVKIRDIEQELADYCSVARDSIVGIKRGLSLPSLPVGMKIAEFFGKPVEEIFWLISAEERKQIRKPKDDDDDE